MTAPLRRRQPPQLPPIAPETTTHLAHPDGGALVNITPELAKAFEAELRRFRAAAEPWHRYDVHVKQYAECRCGTETNHPGPRAWMWRKITGDRYTALKRAIGRGRRSESLCPPCQRAYGLADHAA